MATTTYGIFSDIHKHPEYIGAALAKFKDLGIQYLVGNGDIGDQQEDIEHVLKSVGESDIPAYIQPGSHEEFKSFEPVIAALARRYPNLINCVKERKHTIGKHDLVFLPGSDWTAGGQYLLSEEDEEGIYLRSPQHGGFTPLEETRYSLKEILAHPKASKALFRMTNISSLCNLITDAERTIVFCHVPPKYENLDISSDMAHFLQGYDLAKTEQGIGIMEIGISPGFLKSSMKLKGAHIIDMEEHNNEWEKIEQKIVRSFKFLPIQQLFVERKANRGNEKRREVAEKIGYKKDITGHFHESVGRAHTFDGKFLPSEKHTDELAWMASYMDNRVIGILSVDDNDNTVSYKNIQF